MSVRADQELSITATTDTLRAAKYEFTAADSELLNAVEKGCFQYLWTEVGDPAKLAKDKTSDTICSTAAVGFQLSSLPIGVERGWITREQGQRRASTVLRALVERKDNKKFGIYLHFLDERNGGLPDFSRTKYHYELTASTVDHALLQAGAMTAASYFGDEVARLADRLVAGADWRAMFDDKYGYLYMGWHAKTDQGVDGPGQLTENHWEWCSDEERLIYFLAVGSPGEKHALEPATYYRLKRVVKRHADMAPYVVSWNGSLFTYFFSHCWIDYRHLAADHPQAFGANGPSVDWFENSRRAVLTQRARCIDASRQFPTLGKNRWGLAPCAFRDNYLVHEVRPNIDNRDDWLGGVVPPYAAGSAIMFTPKESMAALREYKSLRYPDGRPLAWRDPDRGGYAFVDSFSLSPPYGQDENLGIDVGPLLLAIENVRTGLVWRLFMQHKVAQRAVERLRLEHRP
ncbi:MAG TPA: glucoamylase family protein [Lacipirellulaceae bacterium]|nr:glucoamylase family protein [Lacipirellulaceae bacterium]